jgi:NADPH:quinone reductase-like Zn-dependent oxidoreductase
MKAIVWTNYGPPDVLQLKEVEKPTPKANEVLIKVRAATVTAGDCEIRALKLSLQFQVPLRLYMGFSKPARVTILGQELAGDIEAVGEAVTRFKPGDAIFGPCFLRLGAYAEFASLREKYLLPKPANLTYAEAATIPTGGISGVYFLKTANLQAGQQVLIYGAGGSIGTYAVQIAKAWGAEVTCVDSGEKLDMLRSIGADHVIDYRREDFSKSGKAYDVIVDVVGKSSFSGSLRSLKSGGYYILGNDGGLSGSIRSRWTSLTTGKKVINALANYAAEDYATLLTLIEAGKIRPVIDKTYPLEQTAEAHRYVEAGHKKGNVAITVGG